MTITVSGTARVTIKTKAMTIAMAGDSLTRSTAVATIAPAKANEKADPRRPQCTLREAMSSGQPAAHPDGAAQNRVLDEPPPAGPDNRG